MDELRETGVEEEYQIQLAFSAKEDLKGIQIEVVNQISLGSVLENNPAKFVVCSLLGLYIDCETIRDSASS
ncbi:hypothetical protein HanHA300_Chr09g0311581 [Helianthus annuus]|nr:hypothetical protein HanHA300_Chr09g0311581 [Helianthus annuus]KAJ0621103.1 hypothetical protein HanIR_Chr01g0004871 [Helianthus annuus]KAJ0625646.1 hypothetical protein HanHA89_Chr01g0003971 [Helianthus annuus]KAJ0782015.1 hypothetical protein HanLR1_Chr01g0003311 [Helianthus annuus]KAJ0892444.1 hypothetical protein HanPSC8_Chr09g0365921 [Helianthus annuus]